MFPVVPFYDRFSLCYSCRRFFVVSLSMCVSRSTALTHPTPPPPPLHPIDNNNNNNRRYRHYQACRHPPPPPVQSRRVQSVPAVLKPRRAVLLLLQHRSPSRIFPLRRRHRPLLHVRQGAHVAHAGHVPGDAAAAVSPPLLAKARPLCGPSRLAACVPVPVSVFVSFSLFVILSLSVSISLILFLSLSLFLSPCPCPCVWRWLV